jgi:class 3 adenylate cyclase/tetratricopeptide (TPR) repeat protein
MKEPAARAATFLFTDIEGSTQLVKLLRDRYPDVQSRHQQLVRDAFAEHGGQEIDTQGDAFFAVFARARDAVLSAVAVRRALAGESWPEDVELRLRIGIHTGEALVTDDRYHGLPVHRAARICALGHGGQILISEATRHLLEDEERSLDGVEFRDLGEHELKDFDRPVRLFGVYPVDLPEPERKVAQPRTSAPVSALPGPLTTTPPSPFVGRSSELAALRALLPLAEDDRLRLALLAGEPGSGKSRLVRELAHGAGAEGVLVLYGSCDAVVNTPYQPFVEALDFLVGVLPPDVLRWCVGTGGGELTRLLPDLPARLGPLGAPSKADPDTERHRLHTGISDLLERVGQQQPVLLVVDDLHWADPSTLHLFRHLARVGGTRTLMLATYRDREPESRPVLTGALADISRLEGLTRIRLEGLERDDIDEFVRRSAAGDVEASEVAPSISELTAGNPFLLCELWRALVESDALEVAEGRIRLTQPIAEISSPESVREVVQFRLSKLGDETRALLEVAAVIGAEFELRVLRTAASLGAALFPAALDDAVRSGTIEELPGPALTHRFTHELVRRAVSDDLTGVRRAELHNRVGEALEEVHAANPARVLPALAHHFTLAAAVSGPQRAVHYNVKAAEAALSALAYEDAGARYTQALELGVDGDRERAQLQIQRGRAFHFASQWYDALDAFSSAAILGRELGDAQLLAEAALGYEEASNIPGITDLTAIELLGEARASLGPEDSALLARVLSALSRALGLRRDDLDDARAARESAIEMARRLDDPATLALVLTQEDPRYRTGSPEEALAILQEGRELASEMDASYLVLEATWRTIATLVSLGDLVAAREELVTYRRLVDESRQPVKLYSAEVFGSALALCDGRLDDAEAMAERAARYEEEMRAPPSGSYGIQLFGIRREQGRLEELRPIVHMLGEGETTSWAWRPGLVALLVELALDEEARAEMARLRADDFESVVREFSVPSLVYLADACSALADRESAGPLYKGLSPLAGRMVQIGQVTACYGSADRYLGMLATVGQEWDVAEAHFERALLLNRQVGANTWTAHTAYQYARMLRERGRNGDEARAREQLAHAALACAQFGLRGLADKLERLEQPGTAV